MRVWLSGDDTPKVVKTEELQSVESRPDGSTKFAIRFNRDLIIPTSADESLKLVNAINALIDERRATELRDKEAAKALKRKLQENTSGIVRR